MARPVEPVRKKIKKILFIKKNILGCDYVLWFFVWVILNSHVYMCLWNGKVLPEMKSPPFRNIPPLDPHNNPQSQGGQPNQSTISGVITQLVIGVTTLILVSTLITSTVFEPVTSLPLTMSVPITPEPTRPIVENTINPGVPYAP